MKLKITNKIINYEVNGKGEHFLLVHGWGGGSKSLESLGSLLAKKYKVIALDLPGFGKSDKPDPDWGVGEYAQFIIDFFCKF